MSSKPYEHIVRGDPKLLERLAKEEPEFIIEDATSSGSAPPAASSEAQIFIGAAEEALKELNRSREPTGHNDSSES
jgi:hypothetical protein